MKYLTPSLSDQQVYDIVKNKILTNTPFCLTRFGDGEIYFLNDNVPEVLQQKVCALWGHVWPNDYHKVKHEIVDIITRGLNESDIIGLLDPNNPICKKLKYNPSKWSIDSSKLVNPIVCDHQITRNPLFGDIEHFKELLNGTPVHIISPNIESLKNNEIDRLLNVPISYTYINNNREQMLNDITNIKETVVLFGASLYGKDLGVILKQYSKISLDFGATLDGWAGLYTRPWFNKGNIQEYCLIKKV